MSNSKMRSIAASIAALLTVGVMYLVVTEAPAAASFSDCLNGHGCLYDLHGGSGWKEDIVFSIAKPNVCHDFSNGTLGLPNHDNQMSASIETFGGYHFRFFDLHGCKDRFWDQPDDTSADWGDFPSHHDNIASSWIILPN